jgi:lipoate-protein ligase A
MRGRLLDFTLPDPFQNVAMEEVLFRKQAVPVIRIWENQRSVIIGRAQLAHLETNLGMCQRISVPVVRRFSAGGAVYNGPGNVNWTFLKPRGEERLFDAKGVFSAFAGIVVKALLSCSVEAWYEPPNSIVNGSGKVSGMAAYVSSSGVLCHGTLLTDADLGEVEALTAPAPGIAERKYPRSRHVAVANCGIGKREFADALVDASGTDCAPDSPSDDEIELLATLVATRYSKERWNLGDPFGSDDL